MLCSQELQDIDKWGIDIFNVVEYSQHKPLTAVAYKIFQVIYLCSGMLICSK